MHPMGGAVLLDVFNGLRQLEKNTGMAFSMNSLLGRIRIQKNVYILKVMGYKPAEKYDFALYIHGPYSTGLASAYYALGQKGFRLLSPSNDIPKGMIDLLVDINERGVDFLEALTTLLSLRGGFSNPKIAIQRAKELKPFLDSQLWEEALNFVGANQHLWS